MYRIHKQLCLIFTYSSQKESADYLAPHHMKIAGGGVPRITIPLLVFSDETSGNTTKKWNRLETFSLSFAGLPCWNPNQENRKHPFSWNIKYSAICSTWKIHCQGP